ncbi:MAG: hypothetical protein H6844_19280 [Alphaproteobacteria bacterium]|nr:hypothetical protein [Alphaproteobacteria bacterium]
MTLGKPPVFRQTGGDGEIQELRDVAPALVLLAERDAWVTYRAVSRLSDWLKGVSKCDEVIGNRVISSMHVS